MIAIPKGVEERGDRPRVRDLGADRRGAARGPRRKNTILTARTDLVDNEYYKSEPRYYTTAKAVGIGYVPWVFHFNDMVNSDSSPWLEMLQTAIFDGKVDEAIETPARR